MLPKKTIEEYKQIIREEYGINLSDQEATKHLSLSV